MLKVAPEEKFLYKALKKQNFKCEFENDGERKHAGIRLTDARIFIEFDDLVHCISPKQIIAEFSGDKHSKEDEFITIRIPNMVLENHLDEICNAIAVVAKKRIKNINK